MRTNLVFGLFKLMYANRWQEGFGLICMLFCISFFHGLGAQPMQLETNRIPLLNGWTYSDHSGIGYTGYAAVPGSIHADLLANGQIPDPYYRDEINRLGWIDSTTWLYERMLTEHTGVAGDRQVDLVFEGLDTYADVYIDHELVLEARNMFCSWRVSLADYRQIDSLLIQIVFHPAVLLGEKASRKAPWTYPADSDPFPGKPSVFTRKAAYQFGWDFAPSVPGCGIWKSVYLETRSELVCSAAWLKTSRIHGDTAEVIVETTLVSDMAQSVDVEVNIGDYVTRRSLDIPAGETVIQIPLQIPHPRLWWPQHEGTPALYPVRMFATGTAGADSIAWLTGLRTIELDRSPDERGTPFRFIVNGQPVFMVGANWVPADMFPGRVQPETYRALLQSAHEAGFNMLRVWGGGIYESDIFYDLADSLGIMIWQDFMFANTMYPGDQQFLENVLMEATQQIERLRTHPSLALWCGNNEIDVAWKNWGWPETYGWTPDARAWMVTSYQALFNRMLPRLVGQLDSTTAYIHTSPLSNWGDPAELAHGDNHFWGVWHGEMALDSLQTRIPRFMSEYGMQSFPTWSSIQRFSRPEDWQMDSWVMQFHQRSYKGNGTITKYLKMEGEEVDAMDFRTWVEMGQQIQAKAYSMALQAHLGAQPFCMGSLLWQLNEPWPGASWSIIDYYGERKPAFDELKQFIAKWDQYRP
ncbi:MAG: hypothetical protein K9I85_08760 [Saprospiraceae bacterium]|nr:hypothetical protein [Saprospiraceae bacterium]